MAFAQKGFRDSFKTLRPVPAEQMNDQLPKPGTPGLQIVGGGDSWLRRQTALRLVAHHLGDEPAPFRLRRFDGASASGEQLLSAARTVSFSGGPVVLAENAVRLAQPPQTAKGLTGVFLELVEKPPGQAVIIVEWEKNPDRRRKDWKELEKALVAAVEAGRALVLDADAPSERQLSGWIRREAKKRGLLLPDGGAERLAQRFGRELRQQVNEIEKLALYVPDAANEGKGDGEGERPQTISLEEMDGVLGGGSESDLFRFTNELQAGRTDAALEALDLLLAGGESPQALLALLYRHASQLQLAQAAIASGEPPARVLRVPPRVADELVRAGRRFKPATLRRILREIAAMDMRMKTSGVPPRTALASLALLFALPPAKPKPSRPAA